MKKLIVLIAALVALGWFIKSRFTNPLVTPTSLASARPESRPPAIEAPPVATTDIRVDAVPPAPVVHTAKPVAAVAGPYPQMSLEEVLKPNNVFHDAVFGVSATYPEGWSVQQAMRWGENNRENTVFFRPPEGSRAVPSMYYQMYPNGAPAPGNAEAMLREMAEQKEASRSQGGQNDYKNDPGSFVFREVDGHPSLSYFATFTRGDQVQAEYFTRILGDKGYVMFFVRGPVKDVQALIPSVYQMGGTVKPP